MDRFDKKAKVLFPASVYHQGMVAAELRKAFEDGVAQGRQLAEAEKPITRDDPPEPAAERPLSGRPYRTSGGLRKREDDPVEQTGALPAEYRVEE